MVEVEFALHGLGTFLGKLLNGRASMQVDPQLGSSQAQLIPSRQMQGMTLSSFVAQRTYRALGPLVN